MAYVASNVTNGSFVNAGSTVTFSAVDVSGGAGKALKVTVGFREASGMTAAGVTGVTYNGTSMTVGHSGTGFLAIKDWYLMAPASGSNDFVVSYTGATGTVTFLFAWEVVDGVDTGGTVLVTASNGSFDGGAGSVMSIVGDSDTDYQNVATFLIRDTTAERTATANSNITLRAQAGAAGVLALAIGDGVGAGATLTQGVTWNNDGGDSGLASVIAFPPTGGGGSGGPLVGGSLVRGGLTGRLVG